MSTQQKASGGGRKTKSGPGQKESTGGVAVSEQNNNNSQTPIASKKHNNVNPKDAVNNNIAEQPKSEKEKQHSKVRLRLQLRLLFIDEKKYRKMIVYGKKKKSNYIFKFSFFLFFSASHLSSHTNQHIKLAANSRTDSNRSDYRTQEWTSRSHTREGLTVDGDDTAFGRRHLLGVV